MQQARQIIATLPQGRRNVESEAEDVEMQQEEEGNGLTGINEELINVRKSYSEEI